MFFKKKEEIKKVHSEELLSCPRCNIKMQKLKKGDVVIDVCKKCNGMWLDAGEMEKLAEMAQKLKKGGDLAQPEKSAEEGENQDKESLKNEKGKKDGKKE